MLGWVGVFLAIASVQAADELMRVAVLPIEGSVMAQAHSEKLAALLPDGFLSVPLSDAHRAVHEGHPNCRAAPACVEANTPENADLVLALRVAEAGSESLYDLRILRDGALVNRRSEAVSSRTLWAAVERDLHQVLTGWRRDARLYSFINHPKHGDKARESLKTRFPKSPYTQSLHRRNDQK